MTKVLRVTSININNFLANAIVELDKINMIEFYNDTYLFDEEKRKTSLKNSKDFLLLFDDGDKIIGYVEFGLSGRKEYEFSIFSIQIEKDYRNNYTVFKKIISLLGAELINRNVNTIVCTVFKTNQVAIKIYKKIGFEFFDDQFDTKNYLAILQNDNINSSLYIFKKLLSEDNII